MTRNDSNMTYTYADLTVVMISKNEEKAISRVVKEIFAELPGVSVLVVDGSTDETPRLASEAGAKVLREPGGGYGPALHHAIYSAETPLVGTVDADDTYPPHYFKQMINEINSGYDLVGGSRITPRKPATMPYFNYLANMGFSIVSSILLMKRAQDIHTGMRIYRRSKLHELNFKQKDLGFTVELLLFPLALGWKCKEFPINYRERVGDSQLVKWASAKATVVSILRAVKLRWKI